MKKAYFVVALGILASLLVAAGAYLWANGMMDSLYAFRSPLHQNPPAPGAPLGKPLTRRVVFVLIDALRDDTSRKTDVMPFLNQLRQQGAWATVHSRTPSYSAPGYSVLMTGAWPDISDGPAMNPDDGEQARAWTQDNLFSAAHRAGLRTAVSGYFWFEGLIPQDAVDAHFYTPGEDDAADVDVVNAALPWLKSGDYQFILIHIDQVDYAGHHQGGPRDPRWDAAATRADNLLKEIVSTLDLEQDTMLVVSDHGQIDRGGHGGQDPIVLVEPLVLAGAGVRPGAYPDVQQVDVAPTIAALLGLNIPASAQGRVQTDVLTLADEQEAAIHDASAYQQIQLYNAYIPAIGERPAKVLVAPDQNPVDVYEQAMDAAKARRLSAERLPRFALAILLALVPAAVLIWKRSSTVAWLVGGAALYVLLFNFGYAFIAGRTYSLSSVASADDIILFTAGTAIASLALAWMGLSYVLKWFRSTPRQAAGTVMAFMWITLYLLCLPALWSFTLNGAVVTWTTPDIASMFMGFLFALQAVIVAAAGLILTGVTALVAKFNQRQQTPSPL